MSRRKGKKHSRHYQRQTIPNDVKLQTRAQTYLPRKGGQLIATAENDISIPFFNTVLEPQDPTIREKGTSKGLALYAELLRDGRIRATLGKRKSKVTRREWVLEPASEDDRDVNAADGVRDILTAMPFDQLCKDLLSAVMDGYAVSELIWGRNDDGLIVPVGVKSINPNRFRFDKDWKPRLLTKENGIDGEELPGNKFIVHRHDAKDNNPYGIGLGSTLFWHVHFKREGVTYWLTHLNKFSSPTPFGKVPAGTSRADEERFLGYLRSLVQNGALVAPIGTEVDFLEAKRAGEAGFEAWCRYWDEQTAEVVLGSTLATGVKGQGSRAASETHAEETDSIVDDDADALSETLNTTLIRWISELNWPDANPPSVWRPRPRNAKEEEEQKKREHERRQSVVRTLNALRREGFEPKNVSDWLTEAMDTEIVVVERPTPELSKPGQQSFADDDPGPVDFLIDQLAELASDPTKEWLSVIRERLSGTTSYAEASQALLDVFPGLSIDPMGNVLGEAFALSELIGRSDVVEDTGITLKGRGLKKRPEPGCSCG